MGSKRQHTIVTPLATSEAPVVPELTPKLAMVFAKLMSVGCPAEQAIHYCCPEPVDKDVIKQTKQVWLRSTLVIQAVAELNGGVWMNLPKEQRLQLALDKQDAEAAYYLWTTNFSEVSNRDELEKMRHAREMIKSALGQKVDETDPMAAFARFAMDLTRATQAEADAKRKRPPQVVQ